MLCLPFSAIKLGVGICARGRKPASKRSRGGEARTIARSNWLPLSIHCPSVGRSLVVALPPSPQQPLPTEDQASKLATNNNVHSFPLHCDLLFTRYSARVPSISPASPPSAGAVEGSGSARLQVNADKIVEISMSYLDSRLSGPISL